MVSTPADEPRMCHLEQLLEQTPDVLWMFTADWQDLLVVTSAYETIWGRSVESLEADPSSFIEAIHPADRDRVQAGMERLSDGSSVELGFRVNGDEDDDRHVWVSGRPIVEEGTVTKVAGFTRDITDQREHEAELRRRADRLDSLATGLSHDLRNPLSVARGRLALARDACDCGCGTSGPGDHFEAIERAHDRMEALVDDLLALAREEPPESRTRVNLGAVAEECWRTVGAVDSDLVVRADASLEADDRLHRLLENLFRNAIGHNDESVTVRVGTLEDGFYVEDDGSGISPERRDRVFESGFTTSQEGRGFGLDAVQTVAEAHGWDVELTTGAPGGARFEIGGVGSLR